MAKPAETHFHDEELLVTLPNAWILIHVDDNGAPWAKGWQGTKVDWAWEEPGGFFLCELKDPECSGASTHPATAGQPTHIQKTINKLSGTAFPNEFASNVKDTIANQPYAKAAANYKYIVVAAISDPNFNAAVAGPAGLVIERHLFQLGVPMPVLVVNIAEWNAQLSPRTLQRVP